LVRQILAGNMIGARTLMIDATLKLRFQHGPCGYSSGDLAMKPKTKKKPKAKKQIRRILALIHRIAISLHAEAETLQEKTASLIAELDRKKPKRPVRTKKHQR
jgi:hypothetical protein